MKKEERRSIVLEEATTETLEKKLAEYKESLKYSSGEDAEMLKKKINKLNEVLSLRIESVFPDMRQSDNIELDLKEDGSEKLREHFGFQRDSSDSSIIKEMRRMQETITNLTKENLYYKSRLKKYKDFTNVMKEEIERYKKTSKSILNKKEKLEKRCNVLERKSVAEGRSSLERENLDILPTETSESFFKTLDFAEKVDEVYKGEERRGNSLKKCLASIKQKSKRDKQIREIKNLANFLLGKSSSSDERRVVNALLFGALEDVGIDVRSLSNTPDGVAEKVNMLQASKAMVLYGAVCDVEKSISKEHNLVESRLGRITKNMKLNLVGNISYLSGNSIHINDRVTMKAQNIYKDFVKNANMRIKYKMK